MKITIMASMLLFSLTSFGQTGNEEDLIKTTPDKVGDGTSITPKVRSITRNNKPYLEFSYIGEKLKSVKYLTATINYANSAIGSNRSHTEEYPGGSYFVTDYDSIYFHGNQKVDRTKMKYAYTSPTQGMNRDVFTDYRYDENGNLIYRYFDHRERGGTNTSAVDIDKNHTTYLFYESGNIKEATRISVGSTNGKSENSKIKDSSIYFTNLNLSNLDPFVFENGLLINNPNKNLVKRVISKDSLTGNIVADVYFKYELSQDGYILFIQQKSLINGDSTYYYFKYEDTYTGLHNSDFGTITSFSVSPNPASEFVSITSDGELKSISFYNSCGQMVHRVAQENINTTIDISSLPSGIYSIRVETLKGQAMAKCMKL